MKNACVSSKSVSYPRYYGLRWRATEEERVNPLLTYLQNNRIRVKDFSELVEITPQHIYLILNGSRFPSRKVAKKIEEVTKKQVTVQDLLSF